VIQRITEAKDQAMSGDFPLFLKSANKGFIFQEKFHSRAGFDRTLSPNDSPLGLPK
jgi:hypothetical protein